jgi:hypothetical protein
MYFKDFDDNGAVDPILCFYMQGKTYPYVTRDELLDQVSLMRTRFPDYASYAEAGYDKLFTAEERQGAGHLTANYLQTAYFQETAGGKMKELSLPLQAQASPVYAITAVDYNKDGAPDLVLAGNSNKARLRFGKSDANHGVLLLNDGKGAFRSVSQQQSGFRVSGDVRSIVSAGTQLLFGINGSAIKAYKLQ